MRLLYSFSVMPRHVDDLVCESAKCSLPQLHFLEQILQLDVCWHLADHVFGNRSVRTRHNLDGAATGREAQHLARLEGQVLLQEILASVGDFEVRHDRCERIRGGDACEMSSPTSYAHHDIIACVRVSHQLTMHSSF